MINLSFSQQISTIDKYPKYHIINKDTVVIISKQQMININLTYNELDKERELNSNYKLQSFLCTKTLKEYESMQFEYDKYIKSQSKLLVFKDSIISIHEDEILKQKSHKKTSMFLNGGLIIVIILLLF